MRNIITDEWHVHKAKLRKFFHIISSQELLNLSEPCYAPKLRKYEDSLYAIVNVSKTTLQQEIKAFYKGTPAEKWLLENDTTTNLLILILHYFATNKDKIGFRAAMIFYNIRQYSNLFHRNFKFCQSDVFKYTMEHMSKSHIYSREKTIANAIYHFSSQMIHRWEKEFERLNNPMMMSKFVRECRHRHAQSLKSFTISYYDNSEKGNKIGQTKEEITNAQGETSEVGGQVRTPQKIVDLVDKIAIHKFVDIKAMENAASLNSINKTYAEKIVKEVSDIHNSDILLTIYRSYISNLQNINSLCSHKFVANLKTIIRGKNQKTKFFKEANLELLQFAVKKAKINKEYDRLTQQSKYAYLNFMIFYLCWSLKNFVCKH